MPWIGPDSTSWRDRLFADARFTGAPFGAAALVALRWPPLAVFFELTVFFELDFLLPAFFGAAAFREGVFARAADFFDVFFFDGLAALREAVFLLDAFFREVFFAADLLADFFAERAAAFRVAVFFDDLFRAAVLRLAFALAFDFTFELLALTFRLLPVAFLPAAALRVAAFFLLVPALLRFLLAAFFAGIRTPAGLRKTRNYTSLALIGKPEKRRFSAGPEKPAEAAKRGRKSPAAGARKSAARASSTPVANACLSRTGDIVLCSDLL